MDIINIVSGLFGIAGMGIAIQSIYEQMDDKRRRLIQLYCDCIQSLQNFWGVMEMLRTTVLDVTLQKALNEYVNDMNNKLHYRDKELLSNVPQKEHDLLLDIFSHMTETYGWMLCKAHNFRDIGGFDQPQSFYMIWQEHRRHLNKSSKTYPTYTTIILQHDLCRVFGDTDRKCNEFNAMLLKDIPKIGVAINDAMRPPWYYC